MVSIFLGFLAVPIEMPVSAAVFGAAAFCLVGTELSRSKTRAVP